jgi:hypothetical protein
MQSGWTLAQAFACCLDPHDLHCWFPLLCPEELGRKGLVNWYVIIAAVTVGHFGLLSAVSFACSCLVHACMAGHLTCGSIDSCTTATKLRPVLHSASITRIANKRCSRITVLGYFGDASLLFHTVLAVAL